MSFTTTGGAHTSPQFRKIVAHSSHLLTAFIQLRERYALLHPMLFVEHVPKQYGSWKQARGFTILKTSLFLSCCQDIAKLITDHYDDTPSIKKILAKLGDASVRAQFRKRYCDGRSRFAEDDCDPTLADVYKQMALEDEVKDGREFDETYDQAVRLWEEMESSPLLKGFRTIRDKVTAHTEIKLHNDEYKPVDIGTLGIKWGDLQRIIVDMQQLVELIGRLTRDAGFAWDHLDRLLTAAGDDFWVDRTVVNNSTDSG